MGFGRKSYGDSPYGEPAGVTGISPDVGNMLESLFPDLWNQGVTEANVCYSLRQMTNKTGMTLTSGQNSWLQTYLIKIIEDEGRIVPETKQHRMAAQALLDLQIPSLVL